jgi:RsmE family RNA methyltransferase
MLEAMNRILLESGELGADGVAALEGRRARHVLDVLKAAPGTVLRVGVIDGPAGEATIMSVAPERVTLECRLGPDCPPGPALDLVLALPRPKALKRLWAPLASLGVRRIFLVNAARVERVYFDTHWLLPEHYRPLLIEGLEQSGGTRLPRVEIRRRFKPFVEDESGGLFEGMRRLLAHPGAAVCPRDALVPAGRGMVLAVGPEGGWVPYETELLERCGFAPIGLSGGPLRSDVACIALLALAREFLL